MLVSYVVCALDFVEPGVWFRLKVGEALLDGGVQLKLRDCVFVLVDLAPLICGGLLIDFLHEFGHQRRVLLFVYAATEK